MTEQIRFAAVGWALLAGTFIVAAVSGCAAPPTLSGTDRFAFDDADGRPTKSKFAMPFGSKKEAEAQIHRQIAKGRTLESSGKLVEARNLYQKLVVEYPDRYEAYHRLAIVADHQRRHREAQALYAQAIERNATEPQLFNDLGYCLFLQGQLDKAESALFKAVTLSPAEARFRNNLGLVYGHQGQTEKALEEFRRAGSEADAQYNLAFIYASQNDNAAAKAAFQKALASDPTHENALSALKAFERFDADPSAAAVAAEYAPNGARYVPYVEPGQSGPGRAATPQVMQASAMSPARTTMSSPPSMVQFPGAATHDNAASAAGAGGSGISTAGHWSWKGTSQVDQ